MRLSLLWEKIQPDIKEKIGQSTYETWFSSIRVKDGDGETLIIETPDVFFKNWIVDHYQGFLSEILNHHASHSVQLEFAVNSGILQKQPRTASAKPEQILPPAPQRGSTNPRFSFDSFVVGPSNRFSHAASLAVAESPSKAYNPLFIYGHVGLGKTHLMQAITNKLREIHPRLKHCYMSSEQFTNELIEAIRHRSTSDFRKKYREIDVLLIDDIHFIAGKESTQEEFFHTFNFLHDNRKQIIISSDRPPKEIANLEERLVSRFAWGLITDIQPPDYETRVAILRKKAERETIFIPEDVINFIAEQIKTNIRELEGALIRVAACSVLEEKRITLEMAKAILGDMVKESSKIISVEMIQKAVAEYFKIPSTELRAKKRNKNIVFPRQVAMYLCRQLTHLSLPEIGYAFGGKDHTTVLHSCKKIEFSTSQSSEVKNSIRELTTILKQ